MGQTPCENIITCFYVTRSRKPGFEIEVCVKLF